MTIGKKMKRSWMLPPWYLSYGAPRSLLPPWHLSYQEAPLAASITATGIALYFAPAPFNARSGRTRLTIDIPLIGHWTRDRVSRELNYPTKVWVSYQKLLKAWMINQLHSRPHKKTKRGHFKSLKSTKFFQCTELDWVGVGLQVCR
jgi:pre-mRNA-processing factor 8